MAAPESMTTRDLSGTFVLNKTLSDTKEMDAILAEQGVGWLTRTAISAATITLTIKHYADGGVEHVDIHQALTGGITSDEDRTLDWTDRGKEDKIFGHVVSRTRRSQVADMGEEWLREGWTPDAVEHGVIDSLARSDTPKSKTSWEAHQTWGFEIVGGERRYTRHVHFTGPKGNIIKARITYDFQGP